MLIEENIHLDMYNIYIYNLIYSGQSIYLSKSYQL